MVKPLLIFCNGFGLTDQYWRNIIQYFPDFEVLTLDLGYFSNSPRLLKLPSDKYEIFAIGHSLGWYKLQQLNLSFKASVGLQAFRNFSGYNNDLSKNRNHEITQFQMDFNRSPRACLRHFYQQCGLPNFWYKNQIINVDNLLNDLNYLNLELKYNDKHPQLIIGSTKDNIVTPELIIDNFSNQQMVEYFFINEGYHDLGFNHASMIAEIIREFFYAHQYN